MSLLSPEEIAKVARLSRLSLSPEESATYAVQLNEILAYAEKLDELKTTNVEPTSHSLPLTNVFRDDIPHESLKPEESLANAPEAESQCFKVPPIIQG